MIPLLPRKPGPQGETGPAGPQGDPTTIQAGTGIAVDNTDPASPVISISYDLTVSSGVLSGPEDLQLAGLTPSIELISDNLTDFRLIGGDGVFNIYADDGAGGWELDPAFQVHTNYQAAYVYGSKVLTTADEGHGGNINADYLDGKHASELLVNDDGELTIEYGTDEALHINTSPAESVTYYISPAGSDDTGDGTSGNPWFSPHKAAEMGFASGKNHVLIYGSSGTYDLTSHGQLVFQSSMVQLECTDSTNATVKMDLYWDQSVAGEDCGMYCTYGCKLILGSVLIRGSYTSTWRDDATGNGLYLGTKSVALLNNVEIRYFYRGIRIDDNSWVGYWSGHTYGTYTNLYVHHIRAYGIDCTDGSTINIAYATITEIGAYVLNASGNSYLYATNSIISKGSQTGTVCLLINNRSFGYFTDSTFTFNSSNTYGVYVQNSSFVRITDCTLDMNNDSTGNPIRILYTSTGYIEGCTIYDAATGIVAYFGSIIRVGTNTYSNCTDDMSPNRSGSGTPTFGNYGAYIV